MFRERKRRQARALLDEADALLDDGDAEGAARAALDGRRLARAAGDAALDGELAVVVAAAANELAEHEEALAAADAALAALGRDADALYERGSALFELGRFAEARAALEEAVRGAPDDAWVHHLLGLALEWTGDAPAADKHFSRARRLAPEDFPKPVRLSDAEFDRALREAVEALPAEIRARLGDVSIAVKRRPEASELRPSEGDRPLSPQLLGLFRGPSLRDGAVSGALPPTIHLFHENLARACATRAELVEEIGITIVHEIGHYLGLDEDDLHAHGLG